MVSHSGAFHVDNKDIDIATKIGDKGTLFPSPCSLCRALHLFVRRSKNNENSSLRPINESRLPLSQRIVRRFKHVRYPICNFIRKPGLSTLQPPAQIRTTKPIISRLKQRKPRIGSPNALPPSLSSKHQYQHPHPSLSCPPLHQPTPIWAYRQHQSQ
jgi:hypothetical protein